MASRSILKRLSKTVERLHELATEYRSIQNPATLHFKEVADSLTAIIENPRTVDEGSQYNLSSLRYQLEELARTYRSVLLEMEVMLVEDGGNALKISATYKRHFDSGERFGRNEHRVFRVPFDRIVEESEEWLKQHSKEAEEQGLDLDNRPVTVDKDEEAQND